MKTTRMLCIATGAALALGLAGCWGDDGGDSPPTPASTEVPDSAGLSTAAFIAYLVTLPGNDESSEPLTVKAGFAVPADETSEPAPLP